MPISSSTMRNVPARQPSVGTGPSRQPIVAIAMDQNQNSERIITIYVGTGEHSKQWAVHSAYFASLSPILKKKFDEPAPASTNPGFNLGPMKRSSIRLPEDDPKIFNMVRNWVYAVAFSGTGNVPTIEEKEPDPEIEEVKLEEGVSSSQTAMVTAATATPREMMELFVLAHKLQIIGLKNAAVDALFDYYHGPDAIYMVAEDQPRAEGRKPRPREIRRCPNLRDVKFIFENTSKTAKIRQLLTVTVLFFLFFKRAKRELPSEWQEVLTEKGEIGFAMISMIGTWGWTLGDTVPSMKVKDPCAFHDGHEHGVTGPCGSVQISGQNSLR